MNWVTAIALTVGLEGAVLAIAAGIVALVQWVLGLTADGGRGTQGGSSRLPDQSREPAWWPEFERQFADWIADRRP